MQTLVLPNVSPLLMRKLRRSACSNGCSVEAEALAILNAALKPHANASTAALLAELARFKLTDDEHALIDSVRTESRGGSAK